MENIRKRFIDWISMSNPKVSKPLYRIFLRNGIQENTEVRFDTIKEVIDWCLENSEKCLLENYMVQFPEDVKIRTDDILHLNGVYPYPHYIWRNLKKVKSFYKLSDF